MTELKDRLIKMIAASGPISLSDYMNTCLHDRQHGYYATRPGLGRDFITAPEMSQVFGELLGLWAAHTWQQMGAPQRVSLVEVGPGRGTLMRDALRAAATVPDFAAAVDLYLVEPSPVLRASLIDRLGAYEPEFLDKVEDIPTHQPFILLANEWLDCLPVRQFTKSEAGWHERLVGADGEGVLYFGLSKTPVPPLPGFDGCEESCEVQPGLDVLVTVLGDLFSRCAGSVLLVDYGPVDRTPEDTLRAYKDGEQVDPLAEPGVCDLTVDVDFAQLRHISEAQGLSVSGPVPQGHFLLSLGAEARLNQLAKLHPEEAETLYAGVKKLVDAEEMGMRFNAICLQSPGLPKPAGF